MQLNNRRSEINKSGNDSALSNKKWTGAPKSSVKRKTPGTKNVEKKKMRPEGKKWRK